MTDEILARYRGWLLKVSVELAPKRPNDWLDLAQEGWIAMWKALKTFDPGRGAEASYLTTAARLRMVDCLRRDLWTGTPGARGHRRDAPAVPVDPDWDWVDELVSSDAVYAELEAAYHHGEIAAALDALPVRDRAWIYKHIICDSGRYSWRHHPMDAKLREILQARLSHLREM
jgi:DNA-directed RNA polymerase specialized sigma24 family protein